MSKSKTKKNFFNSTSKERGFLYNLILTVVVFLLFYCLPSIIYIITSSFIKSDVVNDLIARILVIGLFLFLYYKDLVQEFKEMKKDTGKKIGRAFKYYGIGLAVMMISNLLLLLIFHDISTNETEVRKLLVGNPVTMMFTISILAPLLEELVFRKSISPILKNKWIFALVSGVLFGLGHLMVDFQSGNFQIYRLLYLIPYGSLGFAFALMNRENKSTFSSIGIHCLHNFLTGLLILSQGGF